MIIQKRLFGIPLVTQAQRRRAVVAYYLLIVLAILPALIRSKIMGIDMAIQSLMIGSIFGGFIFGGPVKPYIGTSADGSIPSGIQNLNLGAAKPWGAIVPLDERESAERDAAHYSAYVILRWSLFPITIIYFLLLGVVPQWVAHNSPTLFWLLVVVIISLPQSVILWNEAAAQTRSLLPSDKNDQSPTVALDGAGGPLKPASYHRKPQLEKQRTRGVAQRLAETDQLSHR